MGSRFGNAIPKAAPRTFGAKNGKRMTIKVYPLRDQSRVVSESDLESGPGERVLIGARQTEGAVAPAPLNRGP